MQTWFDFDLDIIDTAVDQQRGHLRSCVHAGGGHFKHNDINVHLCYSPEHFMKLSMKFDARNGYFVVSIKR